MGDRASDDRPASATRHSVVCWDRNPVWRVQRDVAGIPCHTALHLAHDFGLLERSHIQDGGGSASLSRIDYPATGPVLSWLTATDRE